MAFGSYSMMLTPRDDDSDEVVDELDYQTGFLGWVWSHFGEW